MNRTPKRPGAPANMGCSRPATVSPRAGPDRFYPGQRPRLRETKVYTRPCQHCCGFAVTDFSSTAWRIASRPTFTLLMPGAT